MSVALPVRETGHLSSWAHLDINQVPDIKTELPGPRSQALHARCTKHFKGLSEQVKLFPVAFDSGKGCELLDVDGNRYIDFSSGIYVTTLGHCHPKITEAVQRAAATLMNCHDFTTEIKTKLVEKLAEVLPGDLNGFQFYDSGTTAVEAGQRVLRAATGKHEMLSCFYDYHGKTYGGVSLGHIRSQVYGPVRAPGMHMVPRPDTYRPMWAKDDGTIDTDKYIEFYDQYIDKGTVHSVAGFVLEPIQGWGGSIMPPRRFFSKTPVLLRRERHPHDGRRSTHQLGADRQVALYGTLGRRARYRFDRQGLWQRLSRHVRSGPRTVQGIVRKNLGFK